MRLHVEHGPRHRRRFGSAILMLAIGATSLLGSAQARQLRLVSTAWPPFTNQPGQPRFALDLVEAALGRIGLGATTTIVDAAQFTPSLFSGPFDGSAAAWKDADRERVMFFSEPYLENRLVLVGRQGSDVSATAFAGLKGKRIAIVEGYSYGETIDNAGPTFVRSRGEEDSLALLLKSAVDYALMDELVVQYIVANHANEARTRLQFGATPLLVRPLYLAVRRELPDAQSIVNRFNTQLRGMITDGTYHRFLHVSWIRADVDGDGVAEYVPDTDRPGPTPPQRAYVLSTAGQPPRQSGDSGQRFFIGGNIYQEWAEVPDLYKVPDLGRPDPSRSTASLFRFSW